MIYNTAEGGRAVLKNHFTKLPEVGDIWVDGDAGSSGKYFLILGDLESYSNIHFKATCLILESGTIENNYPIYTIDEFIA